VGNGFSQLSKGSNYFFLGNDQNEFRAVLKNYPIDTAVVADSNGTKGVRASANMNLMLGYQVAVSNHLSVGLLSRMQSSKESTYKIGAIGPSIRYHFGFDFLSKPKKIKLKSSLSDDEKIRIKDHCNAHPKYFHYFTDKTGEERLKSLFFIEGSALFGSIRGAGKVSAYSEYSLMAGLLFRFPKADIRIVRNFGLEASLGAKSFMDIALQNNIAMNAKLGIVIFLDRKYTRLQSVKRAYEFLEK
jgi:hypothetical protein